jgi:hypothetical protein
MTSLPACGQWSLLDSKKPQNSRGFSGVGETTNVNSDANQSDFGDVDPDLAKLIAAWPTLTPDVRQAILSHLAEG